MSLGDAQYRGGLLTERGRARSGRGLPIWVATSCALAVLTTSEVSLSQSPPILELRWDAPSQCPQGGSVQDRIRALIGSTEVRPDQLRAEGQIIRSGDKYHLTLVVRSGSASGTRTLESDSCDHLAGAAAVALGLLVRLARTAETPLTSEALGAASPETGDPGVDRPTAEGHDAPSSSTGNAIAPATAASGKSETPPAHGKPPPSAPVSEDAGPDRNFRVLLRAPSAEIGLGILPELSAGYAAGVGASYGGWQAVLTGGLWPRRTYSSELPEFDLVMSRSSLEFDGCRVWRLGRFEWGPCIRAGFAHVVASSTGKGIIPRSASTSMFSAGAVLGTKVYFTRWFALFLTASGELPTSRPRLVTQEVGELYRFPVATMKFGLGSEWVF
jgi:hypothetical protein